MKNRLFATVALLATLLFQSCASCHPAEPPSVAEYLDLIRSATAEALDKARAQVGNDGGADRIKVAVTPVICTGELDLNSNRGAFQDGISREITNSNLFVPINAGIVAAAMRAANIGTAEELYTKGKREAFLDQLKTAGYYPTFWIFAKFNTLKTERSGCIVELAVELDLRFVNSTTGVEANPGVKQILRNGSL
jgi:hypothetical protein